MSSETMVIDQPFSRLDDDLHILIFARIEWYRDRVRPSRVCKSWRRILSSPSAWPTTQTKPLAIHATHLPHLLGFLSGAPQHVSIWDVHLLNDDEAWMQAFLKMSTNTDSLTLTSNSGCRPSWVIGPDLPGQKWLGAPAALFALLPRLTHLDISIFDLQHRDDHFVATTLDALTSAKRSSSRTSHPAPPLQHFSAGTFLGGDASQLLLTLSEHHSSLTSLHIGHFDIGHLESFPPATASTSVPPSSPFPHLTHLSLENIHPADAAPLIRALPSLKSLSFTFEKLDQYEVLIAAIADSLSIERLRLGFLSRFTRSDASPSFRDVLGPLSRSTKLNTLEVLPVENLHLTSSAPLRNVHHLRIPFLGSVLVLSSLLPSFPNLDSLVLGSSFGCSSPFLPIPTDGHIVPADQYPSTTSLTLPSLDLTESSWETLFKLHPHLLSFAMRDRMDLPWPMISSLRFCGKRLTTLILPMLFIADSLARDICDHLPHLTHLELDLTEPVLSPAPKSDELPNTTLIHILSQGLPDLHTLGSFPEPNNSPALPPFDLFPHLRIVLTRSPGGLAPHEYAELWSVWHPMGTLGESLALDNSDW